MALLIVLTMSHPHVGFYSKINICFYAKFYGQSFGNKTKRMQCARRRQQAAPMAGPARIALLAAK